MQPAGAAQRSASLLCADPSTPATITGLATLWATLRLLSDAAGLPGRADRKALAGKGRGTGGRVLGPSEPAMQPQGDVDQPEQDRHFDERANYPRQGLAGGGYLVEFVAGYDYSGY